MSNDVVQAAYDELATIAERFGQQAQATTELQSRLQRSFQALEDGGWIGQGSDAFFAEMNGEVNPAIQRMTDALEAARAVTLEISSIIRQAEEEAAAPFQGQQAPAPTSSPTSAPQGDSDGGGGFMKGVHEVLDWAGFIPGVGAVPDVINAGIYAIEGDFGNAALSGVAAVPVVGDAIKGVDKARDVVKAVDKLGDAARAADKVDDAADATRAVDKVDDAADAARTANNISSINPTMQDKILRGQRVPNPNSPGGMSNEIIGGHSPSILNDSNYAVEVLAKNADGTTNVKYTTQFPDGNLAKIKKSTLAPDSWSDQKIIDTTVDVGNSPAVATRARDGATLHRQTVDGVQWEVIRDSSGNVTSSYPTGGTPTNNF